jgi:hypothetical protein
MGVKKNASRISPENLQVRDYLENLGVDKNLILI